VHGSGQQVGHVGQQFLRHHQRLVDAFMHGGRKDRSVPQYEERRVQVGQNAAQHGDKKSELHASI
jgi:hypothetical protein